MRDEYSNLCLFIHVFVDGGFAEIGVKGKKLGEKFMARVLIGEIVHAELLFQMIGCLQKFSCFERDLLLKQLALRL